MWQLVSMSVWLVGWLASFQPQKKKPIKTYGKILMENLRNVGNITISTCAYGFVLF